ncbi:MAG TPA: OmpA family protein, partial [Stellaceae bacterium]|nr:OmpA family protein [Stellaceae bacterium]
APPPPVVKPVVDNYSISQHPICFNSGSTRIDHRFDPDLKTMADWLTRHPEVTITIEGHTDDRGTREFNLAVAQARAESMRRALAKLGVATKRMRAVGYGTERPLASGSTEAVRRKDRCAIAIANTLKKS